MKAEDSKKRSLTAKRSPLENYLKIKGKKNQTALLSRTLESLNICKHRYIHKIAYV